MRNLIRLMVVVVFAGWGVTANATLIKLEVGGFVESVDPLLSSLWSVGDTVSMVAIYETNIPQINPVTCADRTAPCIYEGAVNDLEILVGAYLMSGYNLSQSTIAIRDDSQIDGFFLNLRSLTAPVVAGLDFVELQLGLLDFTAAMFDSVAIPSYLPSANYYSATDFVLSYQDPTSREYHNVLFTTGSVDTSPIPTPATLALFGIGLAGLGWSRRKKVYRTKSSD